jgi:hypothetical protein
MPTSSGQSVIARRLLVDKIREQVAMWADESAFGHEIRTDELYEEECSLLAEEIGAGAMEALVERPVR